MGVEQVHVTPLTSASSRAHAAAAVRALPCLFSSEAAPFKKEKVLIAAALGNAPRGARGIRAPGFCSLCERDRLKIPC